MEDRTFKALKIIVLIAYLILFVLICVGCENKLEKVIQNPPPVEKKKKPKVKDTIPEFKVNNGDLQALPQDSFKKVEMPKKVYQPIWEKSVRKTISEVVKRDLKSVSDKTKDIVIQELLTNERIVEVVDKEVQRASEQHFIKQFELGFKINIDKKESVVNISNRFKYKASNGVDSLIRVKLRWEKKKNCQK